MPVDEFYLGEGRVQAFVYHDGEEAHMAVQPYLADVSKRARSIEKCDYDIYPPKNGARFLTWPTCAEEIDARSVRAHERQVEKLAPEWIALVKEQWCHYRDLESTIFWSGLDPEPVKAIVLLLWARGEIPPDGDWLE